ncbi:hypothetical protein TNCV_1536221 [Trichonephila clavipes]|nr:hypothetical protein TNCV_1536221 [Trichonephila clavipes]
MIAGKEHSSGPVIVLPFFPAALDVKVGNHEKPPSLLYKQSHEQGGQSCCNSAHLPKLAHWLSCCETCLRVLLNLVM